MDSEIRYPLDWNQLLEELSGNDSDAAREAAFRFTGLIVAHLRRLGVRPGGGEYDDLIASVLGKIWKHASEVSSPVNWVHRVTENALTDHYRGRRRIERLHRIAVGERDPAAADRSWTSRPDERLARTQELALLAEARNELSGMQRAVIDCLYPADPAQEPLSQEEAARTLGIERHVLKYTRKRAMHFLASWMRRKQQLGRFLR